MKLDKGCDIFFMFLLGIHTLKGTTPHQQTIGVSRIYIYEGYLAPMNDIALVKLSSPVKTSPQVNTVCLPKQGSRAPTGSQCYITGQKTKIDNK